MSAITFEQIEHRTESSLALAIWAKQASATVLAFLVCNTILGILSSTLKDLDGSLTTENLDGFTDEQLRDLALKLKELVPRLKELCLQVESPAANRILYTPFVEGVCKATDNLDSSLEDISFALRPDFHDAVSSAINGLGLKADSIAAVQH
jgi:hypothetical protein